MPATKKKPNRKTLKRSSRKPVTPDDLKQLKFIGDPQISPDGSLITFVHKHDGEKNAYHSDLWMADTTGKHSKAPATSSRTEALRWGRPTMR